MDQIHLDPQDMLPPHPPPLGHIVNKTPSTHTTKKCLQPPLRIISGTALSHWGWGVGGVQEHTPPGNCVIVGLKKALFLPSCILGLGLDFEEKDHSFLQNWTSSHWGVDSVI